MIPAMVYPGMTASVAVNPMKATKYKHENELPIDLRIDGTSFDLSELYDTDSTLEKEKRAYVTGKVTNEERNATASVSAFFRGAGYAMYDTSTIQTCAYDDS